MKELTFPFDNSFIIKNKKKLKKILLNSNSSRIKKKIAVLCGSTANDIVSSLELFLLDCGIEPLFYISEYNKYWEDAVFGNDELEKFQPDIIIIHTTSRNITEFSESFSETAQTVNQKIDSQFEKFSHMWEKLQRFNCPVIQNNFETPLLRPTGNADFWEIHGKTFFINSLNIRLAEYAQTHKDFYINDINYLASCFGLEKWHNASYWYMYKYAMSLDAVPEVAYSLACIIKSIYGKNKKLIALDLDNTLWGGVIGDDGQEGIEIGHENADAEAFEEFQRSIKEYKKFGVLLGVCSKNDEENALLGLNHPETVLTPDDFVNIKANWNPKDRNLIDMSSELSLLPESFVFIDDNPAECHIVESQISGINTINFQTVQEASYKLSRSDFFELTKLSSDDLKRNDMYIANAKRESQKKSFADYGEYLLSLEMNAVIEDFRPVYLQRITQLTNKSNQFNLTTKRYSDTDMQKVFESDRYIRLYGRLSDRFGDNGIVSVVIGEKNNDNLSIDLWLMSCRVLKREMEFAMLDTLVAQCRLQNIRTITGYYFKTAKNNMVSELYKDFGFSPVKKFENGDSVWKLDISDYKNLNHAIRINESECISNG